MKNAVLLVSNFFSSGFGTTGVCEELAHHLGEHGWDVITTSGKRSRAPRLLDMIITVFRERKRYSIGQVDVYSGKSFLWAEVVCWMLKRFGKPIVLTLHGGNLPSFSQRWPRRVRFLLDSATVVTTPSRYLSEQMRPYCDHLTLLPNPLAIKKYPFRLRQNPQPRLIWLRTFHKIYNPSLAPRVVSILVSNFSEIHLTMIGPDKADGSLKQTHRIARELGVSDRLSFTGGVPKSDIPSWLNKGDIFLNTSNIDNTPISVLEAMACGLYVVSTNVGGIPYLLENEKDALIVPPNDPEAMARAVRRILTEEGLAVNLSNNARMKAETFDWSMIFPQWEDLLSKVIGNTKK